jgi:hypothetical protein
MAENTSITPPLQNIPAKKTTEKMEKKAKKSLTNICVVLYN